MKRRIQNFIILATTIILLNGIMLVGCQKEDVVQNFGTQTDFENLDKNGLEWTVGDVNKANIPTTLRTYLGKTMSMLSRRVGRRIVLFSYTYHKQQKLLHIRVKETALLENAKWKLLCKGNRDAVEECTGHWLTFNVGCSVKIIVDENNDDFYYAYGCCDCNPA